jgi:nitrogen fixation NifU-like protein
LEANDAPPHEESNDSARIENMGKMEAPDGSAFIKGLCGDSMEIYLKISDATVVDARFDTDGCFSSKYCGAMAAFMAKGKSLQGVLRLSPMDILDAWGKETGLNVHCAILAIGTLHKAVADYLLRTQGG